MMNRLLVLMPKQNDGVTWYRIRQFERKCNELGLLDVDYLEYSFIRLEKTLSQIISVADGYFLRASGMVGIDFFEIIEKYKPKNKPFIVDIDDNYELINPLSDMYGYFGTKEVILPDGTFLWKDKENNFDIERNKKNIEKITNMLRLADLVITTTFKMKEWIENYNKNVVVVPNCIDEKFFPYIKHEKDNLVRVGYALGSSHFEDLMSILPSLKKMMEKYPHVHYYHIGQWFGVVDRYIPKNRLHKYGWINADGHGYRMTTLNLDIGLCPLTDHEFNFYKSSVKYYEWSAIKTVTLAKDMLPYNEEIIDGENGFLYKTTKEFEEKLEYLILNPVKRMETANNAYNFVYKYRDLNQIALDWAFVINELINYKKKDYNLMSDLSKVAEISKKNV